MANQLTIKQIREGYKGLFTSKPWLKDQIIVKFEGKEVKASELNNYTKEQQANLLQIGKQLYLDLKGEHTGFINHSCNANCRIVIAVNTAFLLANRDINKDEELTFDYSTTSTDTLEEWSMVCGCHRYFCRGIISGFQTLPEKKQQELIKNKMVPRYIAELKK